MDIISYAAASDAQATADSKSKSFYQESAPSEAVIGDTWTIPSTGKKYDRTTDGTTEVWLDASTGAAIVDGGNSKAASPKLDSYDVVINEGSSTDVTITDWFDSISYEVESTDVAVATVSRVGNTITITGSDILSDSSTTVRIKATVPGLTASDWTNVAVDVIFIDITADDAYVDNLAADDSIYNDGWEIV